MLAFLAVLLSLLMAFNPQAAFTGASYGLKTWFSVLIPSLLPFFIISDILIELGVVNFLGILLEPLMRPFFRLPGAAGFVLAMGFTSGFPMGAVLTNTLFEKNLCTREEAARLIAFTNNSSPLFLLVAVPIGMFENPALGIILLISHYSANLLFGILLGLKNKNKNFIVEKKENILKKSFAELLRIHQKSKLTIGSILGNAVSKSIQNMLSIGGFVIFFAVLIEIFHTIGVLNIFALSLHNLLTLLNLNPSLGDALATGFFEMTMGAKRVSEMDVNFIHKGVVTSFILGWSGLSIQAQVTSIAGRSNIPIANYIVGRFFQGIVAGIITGVLLLVFPSFIPTLNFHLPQQASTINWGYFLFTIKASSFAILILIAISLIFYIFKKIKNAWGVFNS
ncbi:MAG: sporulation integral membrane protein YlbJ [Bacillota bacterium]